MHHLVVSTELKKKKKVTEKLSLNPISDYNKTKMVTERILMSYKNVLKYLLLDLELYTVFLLE